jgi:hypothetical protein
MKDKKPIKKIRGKKRILAKAGGRKHARDK